jgi:hypothetical protein
MVFEQFFKIYADMRTLTITQLHAPVVLEKLTDGYSLDNAKIWK